MDLKYIITALRQCGRIKAIKEAQSLHSHLIKTGSSHIVYAANNLLSTYVDFSFLHDARKLFDEIPERNIVTWTTMVSAYNLYGKPLEALKLYTQMLDFGSVAPNGFMYSVVLKACGIVGDVELGRLIHERVFEEDLDDDVVLMNSLLDMYVKCGCLSEARRVFDGLFNVGGNERSWNTMISGYCKEGLMEEAVSLFYRMPGHDVVSWNVIIAGFVNIGSLGALEFVCLMQREGLKLDEFTVPCGLKTCGYVGYLDMGKQIHCYVLKSGIASCCFIISALIDMYSECNEINEAKFVFDQQLHDNGLISDSLAPWNSMLSGYVSNEQNGAAVSMLGEIHHSGTCFDSYSLSSALKVCINLENLKLGIQVHGLIVIYGYELDYVVGSVLVDLYSKFGNINYAFVMFHRLPKQDTVAWSGLIMGCAEMGLCSSAFSLFRDMVKLDIEIDNYVISNVLKVCSCSTSLGSGKQVHGFCIKTGYEMEGVIMTALIDMYSKGGEIKDSLVLFNNISDRDVVCWTAIIVGCAQNGRAEEAIKVFKEMTRSGLKPNEVTYFGVLTACRHAGFVEEARTTFESMKIDDGLNPLLEHYHCLVDLLGQAGYLDEAGKLINEMPFRPDKTILSSMLSACVTHSNAKLATLVATDLLATARDDPSTYAMVSNAYAALGLWDSLIKVREAAKRLGKKDAGMSWIEVSGVNALLHNP